MVDYKETSLDFLQEDLKERYGIEQGERIYGSACKRYEELCLQEKKRDNPVMNAHIFENILPAIGLYFAFYEAGYSKEDSMEATLKETQINAFRLQKESSKLGRMPFAYSMFRMAVKSYMKKKYPSEGWDVIWKQCDREEIHFDMERCIYYDMCIKYGCPELCTVFCQNDTTNFAGFLPKIKFQRKGTIGEGSERCDFHFVNSK